MVEKVPRRSASKAKKSAGPRARAKSMPLGRALLRRRTGGEHQMSPPIGLPASLVLLGTEGLFLAVADGADVGSIHAQLDQVVLDRVGATVAETHVVLGAAAIVAMALDDEIDIGVGLEEGGVGLQGLLRIGADIRLVIVEIGVLDVLLPEVLDAGG